MIFKIKDKNFKDIISGSIWALTAQVGAAFFIFLINIFIAKYYGAEVLGILAVINAFLILLTTITVFGTNVSIIRLLPEHITKFSFLSAYKLYHKVLLIVFFSSITVGFLFYLTSEFIASKILDKQYLSSYFKLISFFIFFRALTIFTTQSIRGLFLKKLFALMQLLPYISNFFILIIISFFTLNDYFPLLSVLCAYFFTGIAGFVFIEKKFSKEIKVKKKNIEIKNVSFKHIYSISTPMLVSSLSSLAISHTGIIILGIFRDDFYVGIYDVAIKLATLTVVILNAINSMTGPKFSEMYYSDNLKGLHFLAKKSSRLISFITIPIVIFIIFFGKKILMVAFGQEFIIAYPAVVILSIGQLVSAMCGSTGVFMNMTGNQKMYRNILIVTSVANIILNFLFIPSFGIYGAAIVSMLSTAGWNIFTLFFIKNKYGFNIGFFPFLSILHFECNMPRK